MFKRRKKNKPDFIETATARSTIIPITDSKQGLDFLVSFFSAIRPSAEKEDANENMQFITAELHRHPVLLTNLQHALLSQLIRTDLYAALTESGIPLARGFWEEFFGRLKHKLLPSLQSEHDFLYVVNRVFFRSTDYQWVEQISRETWISFFESIGLSLHIDDSRILQQLMPSLKTLGFQVAQLGLERNVLDYISPEDREDNPFLQQNYLVQELEKKLSRRPARSRLPENSRNTGEVLPGIDELGDPSGSDDPSVSDDLPERMAHMMGRCYACIDFIRDNHSLRGASLRQTYILVILANRLDRMTILADLLDNDHDFPGQTTGMTAEGPSLNVMLRRAKLSKRPSQHDTGKFVDFFRMLVRNENRKNSIREFASQCFGYLAYQIAEHKGSKGNKYITSTPAEYRAMLKSAMGGGAWVCGVVIIKNLITKIEMPVFWHGFAYSVNYSVGFVAIEETHTTLATKQPAFTASAVAGSLDTKKNAHQPNLYNLAITVAKVSRSQIASFAGNLIVVFPGVWALAWLYEKIVHVKLVSGAAAEKMLEDNHPWHSLSLLYACNTGAFLFLSGIIAGYVQNKIHYSHIPERLRSHPILRLSFSPERLQRIGSYIEKHAGSIIGNIALGFFLGMSTILGRELGIPFDIRHITISAGNTSLAVYGLGFGQVRLLYLATVLAGVLGIGFLNFAVSFFLAFLVAVKSRGIRLKEYPEFLGILWRYFRKNPLDFIRPRRRPSESD
ncbi:MAG: hypothetical protein P4L51_21140 [Puia sp.]|nr:hypothetical protein [Puia sp.]